MSRRFLAALLLNALLIGVAIAEPPKATPLPEGALRRLGTTDFRVGKPISHSGGTDTTAIVWKLDAR